MAPRKPFSPQIRQIIEAFAASMEFSSMPAPAADGSYGFAFEQSGMLSLLPASDGQEVVMALCRKPISDDEAAMRRFFLQASLESGTSGPLHAGISADNLFCYATRIPVDEFDLPTLESNLRVLMEAHELAA
jgi:hypothetical protein